MDLAAFDNLALFDKKIQLLLSDWEGNCRDPKRGEERKKQHS